MKQFFQLLIIRWNWWWSCVIRLRKWRICFVSKGAAWSFLTKRLPKLCGRCSLWTNQKLTWWKGLIFNSIHANQPPIHRSLLSQSSKSFLSFLLPRRCNVTKRITFIKKEGKNRRRRKRRKTNRQADLNTNFIFVLNFRCKWIQSD